MSYMWRFAKPALTISVVDDAGSAGGGDAYPNRALRFIVPFAAGGPGDVLARLIGTKLTESWGQPVEIDIKPGINGIVGSAIAAKAAPDGYTIAFAAPTHYINPSIYRNLPFDTLRDFAPVSLITAGTVVLVAHPSVPATSIGELIAYVRANPGRLKYTSGGAYGSPSHLAGAMFNVTAGVDMPYVPSETGHVTAGAALSEGREVQVMYDALLAAMPHIRSGEWRALGVTTAKRSPALHDIPTIAECGLPGYEVSPTSGVLAPAGTPVEIVAKLSKQIARIVQMPDVKSRLQTDGVEPIGSTPEQYAAYIKSEIAKWARVVQDAHIKVQDLPK